MKRQRFALMLIAVLMSTQVAMADQIDGDWCSPKGQAISIDGPRVISPSGKVVTATYDRHHIDYEIPAGEVRAGDRFRADQLNDDQISVSIVSKAKGQASAAEIWTPCKPVS